jgi:protein TonB
MGVSSSKSRPDSPQGVVMKTRTACNAPVVAHAAWAALAASSRAGETKPHIDASGVNMQPAYPASALPDREAGAVVLAVVVAADGSVEKISPVKSSGFQDLDEAAVASVMNWRFVPATKDGKATEGSTLVQVMFNPP